METNGDISEKKQDSDRSYGHGAANRVLHGNLKDEALFEAVRNDIAIAKPRGACELPEGQKIFLLSNEAANSPLMTLLYVSGKDGESRVFRTIFPHLAEGVRTKIKLLEVHPWSGDLVEAGAGACFANGSEFSCFLPFYAVSPEAARNGEWYEASLSAILSDVSATNYPKTFEIKEGAFWEEHKKRYLQEHPGIAEEDVPPAELSMKNFSLFSAIEDHADHYSMVGRITAPRVFEFEGRRFCIFESQARYDGVDVPIKCCASVDDAGGVKFTEGETIQATAWLHAFDFVKLSHEESAQLESEMKRSVDAVDSLALRLRRFAEFQNKDWPEAVKMVCEGMSPAFQAVELDVGDEFSVLTVDRAGERTRVFIASTLSGTKHTFTAADVDRLAGEPKENACFVNFSFEREGRYLRPSYSDVFDFEKRMGVLHMPSQFRSLTDRDAVADFCRFINEKNLNAIYGDFSENVHYKSFWADKEVDGEVALHRYLERFLREARKSKVEFWAKLGILHGEVDRPCAVVARDSSENVVNLTVPIVRNGTIVELYVLYARAARYTVDVVQPKTNFVRMEDSDPFFGVVHAGSLPGSVDDFVEDGKGVNPEGLESDDSEMDRLAAKVACGDRDAFVELYALAETDEEAQHNLGFIYENGCHVRADWEKAQQFYETSLRNDPEDKCTQRCLESLRKRRVNPFSPLSAASLVVDKNGDPFPLEFIPETQADTEYERDATLAVRMVEWDLSRYNGFNASKLLQHEGVPLLVADIGGAEFYIVVRVCRSPSERVEIGELEMRLKEKVDNLFFASVSLAPCGDGKCFANYRGIEPVRECPAQG